MRISQGIVRPALLALGSMAAFQALAIDDGQGRDWRQVTETLGLTRAQMAAACPVDGVTACQVNSGAFELEGWVWATAPQVVGLFGQYAPGILTAPDTTIGGFEVAAASMQFASRFALTTNLSGCTTYQGCFSFRQIAGHTASTTETGTAIGGTVVPDSFSGSFSVAPVPTGEVGGRGHWLWRPTGLLDGTVHAYNDKGRLASPLGGTVIASVLSNDFAAGVGATSSNVAIELLGSAPVGVQLDLVDGSVDVAAGTAMGSYALQYRICLRTNLAVCDDALARVTIPSFALTAVADTGRVAFAAGGTPVASVLANDSLGGVRPTVDVVTLAVVSSTHPGVTLDPRDGSVDVAPGTSNGPHTLVYQVCERANPANCAQAAATINPNQIDAVDDSYRMSSKVAGSSPSVFSNDWFNGVRPTSAVVNASIVGSLPAGVSFNSATGVLSTKGKVSSGTYYVQYKICERASPANCDQARVTLDMSGKGS